MFRVNGKIEYHINTISIIKNNKHNEYNKNPWTSRTKYCRRI